MPAATKTEAHPDPPAGRGRVVLSTLLPTLLLLPLLLAPLSPALAGPGLSGRVVDPEGQSLAGATVELHPVRSRYETALALFEGRPLPPVATTRTDGEGVFRLEAPEVGLWKLRLEAAGYAPRERALAAFLPEEDHPPLTLAPRREVAIRVVDPQERPVARALVLARPVSSRAAGDDPDRLEAGVTDDRGRLTLSTAVGRPLRLVAFLPGLAPSEPVETRGRSAVLRLRPVVEHFVTVEDSGGRPVAEALVFLGEPPIPVGRSDEDGRLAVPAPEGAAVWVHARTATSSSAATLLEPPAQVPDDAENGAEEGEGAEAESGKRSPETLVLHAPPTVTGRVVDAEDRTPLSEVLLWAPQAANAHARTGRAGDYTLSLPAAPDGRFRLLALLPRYLPETLVVSPEQVAAGRLPTVVLKPASALAGTVVDAEGKGVAGARIQCTASSSRRLHLARSSRDGTFVLGSLPAGGPVQVRAEKPGYAPTEVVLALLEERRTHTGVRLVLRPGRTVHGRVLDSGEEPVIGAEVSLVPERQGTSLMARFLRRRSETRREPTLTGADGRFTVEHVAAGSYRLHVEAGGFAPAEVPGLEIAGGEEPLDLGTILLEAAARIVGRVVDPDRQPLAGARIRAFLRRPDLRGSGSERSFETTTDGDGRFTVGDLRHGEEVMLHVRRSGYAQAHLQRVTAPTAQPLELVLQPVARVSGTVHDPRGRPVEGARVRVDRTTGPGGAPYSSPEAVETDADGRFDVAEVPPGAVTVHARAQGYLRDARIHLELEPGSRVEDLELTLTPGATVRGRVRGPDGEPVAEASVRWREDRTARPNAARTDGDGEYRLEGVAPGPRTFVVSHPRHARALGDLEVKPGDNRLDFQLEAGYEIRGRVLADDGRPVAGTWLWLSSLVGGDNRRATSDTDGSFSFQGVTGGRYRLRGGHPELGEVALEEPLRVEGSDLSGVEVRFSSGGVLDGRIVGLGLDELASVDVRAFSSQGGSRWTRPDFEGRFRFERLAPGTWHVVAHGPGGRQVFQEVELVEADPPAEVMLEFSPGFTLSGRVLVGSQPLRQGTVAVRREGETAAGFSPLDPEGRFRITGLDEGSYQLHVMGGSGLQHQEEVKLTSDRDLLVELSAARVVGRVLDASDGEPLPGVDVSLRRDSAQLTAIGGYSGHQRTDSTGSFRLAEVVPGQYRLVLSKEGYGQTERPLTVEPGPDPAPLEVRLEPSRGLSLRLSRAEGVPPARWIQVVALGDDGRVGLSEGVPVGENGSVRLSRLPEGTWTLRITATGAAITVVRATAPGPPVPVTLAPEARLEVLVPELAEDESTATLELIGADGRPLQLLATRSSLSLRPGTNTLDQIPAGAWTVQVTAADGRVWSGTVTTVAGQTSHLTLE